MSGDIRPRSKSFRPGLAPGIACLFAAVALAGDDPKDKPEARPDLDPVTKEHLLTKVPNFFVYDYPFPPKAGKRIWLRVDDKTYIERYPDGSEGRFTILGRAKVRDMDGVIVAKSGGDLNETANPNDGSFQVFVPDRDAKPRAILFRHITAPALPEWQDICWSLKRITETEKVE